MNLVERNQKNYRENQESSKSKMNIVHLKYTSCYKCLAFTFFLAYVLKQFINLRTAIWRVRISISLKIKFIKKILFTHLTNSSFLPP